VNADSVADTVGRPTRVLFDVPSGAAMWVVASASWVGSGEGLLVGHGADRDRIDCLLGSRRNSKKRRVDRLRYRRIGGMYIEPKMSSVGQSAR
jgi:hypothetical protein